MDLEDIMILGVGVLAHIGIIVNRQLIRPVLHNKRYNQISLQTEHVIHHVAQTAMGSVLCKYKLPISENDIPIYSAILSYGAGTFVDAVFPMMNGKKLQYDQMASNLIGCTGGYFLLKNIL